MRQILAFAYYSEMQNCLWQFFYARPVRWQRFACLSACSSATVSRTPCFFRHRRRFGVLAPAALLAPSGAQKNGSFRIHFFVRLQGLESYFAKKTLKGGHFSDITRKI
ncbi:MAG: hypothetical protein IKF90_16400 [Parasporobacterium sp.]|nr:hypothetical protein [Parasporobacterium sp.]